MGSQTNTRIRHPLARGFFLFASLTLCAGLCAGAQLSLPQQAGTPGSSIVAPVNLDIEEARISGIQFDLEFAPSAMTISVLAGEVSRSSSKAVYSSDLGGNKKRFLVVGLNRQLLTGGVVMILFINLKAAASPGTYPLKFSGLTCTDADGQALPLSAIDGTTTVQGSSADRVALKPDGVLNGASFLPGPLSPGGLITMLGSQIGPSVPVEAPAGAPALELNGTRVLLNGAPLSILYAAPDQINAVLPYSFAGSSSATLQIHSGDQPVQLKMPVAEAFPALFTLDSSGSGQAVALNEDSSVNSPDNPADRGSVVSLFATGAGDLTPRPQNGATPDPVLPKPVLPVLVEIGGVNAAVISAVAAERPLIGVVRITCRVPAVDPGFAVPVTVRFGSSQTQAGVSLAVR